MDKAAEAVIAALSIQKDGAHDIAAPDYSGLYWDDNRGGYRDRETRRLVDPYVKEPRIGKCSDCNDPAPIGLYKCADCLKRYQECAPLRDIGDFVPIQEWPW